MIMYRDHVTTVIFVHKLRHRHKYVAFVFFFIFFFFCTFHKKTRRVHLATRLKENSLTAHSSKWPILSKSPSTLSRVSLLQDIFQTIPFQPRLLPLSPVTTRNPRPPPRRQGVRVCKQNNLAFSLQGNAFNLNVMLDLTNDVTAPSRQGWGNDHLSRTLAIFSARRQGGG